jgi:hypothetical protein
MAVASLMIAAQGQTASGVQAGAVTGSAEHSDGSWTVYHAAPIVSTSFIDKFVSDSAADFNARLDAMQMPTVFMANGRVEGKGEPTFNHDGKAYAGVIIYQPIAADESVLFTDNIAVLQNEYRENINSGKWRKFVNGE